MSRRYGRVRDEHAEQAALIKWARLHEYRLPALRMLYAIPNGGRRDAVTGARLRDEGVRAGVPDLCLPWPSGRWHGLYIELKAPGGRATSEQRWWIEQLRAAGYRAEVCIGWEAAAQLLLSYLEACNGARLPNDDQKANHNGRRPAAAGVGGAGHEHNGAAAHQADA